MKEENSEEVLGYRKHQAVANSDIKYLHSPRLFKAHKDGLLPATSSSPQTFGTWFEDFLTLSEQEFNDIYIVEPVWGEGEKPNSPNKENFVQWYLTNGDIYEAYLNSYKVSNKDIENGIYKIKANDLYESLKRYITFIEEAQNKVPIDAKSFSTLVVMKDNILCDVAYNNMMDSKGKEIIHQLEIGVNFPVTHYGINWKGKLDWLILDHVNSIAYVVDLKTTSSPISFFHYEVNKYKYYRQIALYRILVEAYLDQRNLHGWTIATRFVAVETTGINEAAVIPIPFNMLKVGYQELEEAAETIKWHYANGWNTRRSQANNNGLLLLDWTSLYSYQEANKTETELEE